MLARNQINAIIDHRSFADQGITEQPTIHEGYIAQSMEKKGMIADRCEINRQIRADNKILRELKAVNTDQTEHTARRFSAWLPPIQCTLSGHQCMLIIQV